MPFSLKVMSFNIRGGAQPILERVSKLANYIKSKNPDIVLLQEVMVNPVEYYHSIPVQVVYIDQTKALAQALGYNYYIFGKARTYLVTLSGIAILSRFQLYDTIVHTISHANEQRVIIEAKVKLDQSHTIRIYNSHLSATSHANRLIGANLIASLIKNVNEPVIVGGDLNTDLQDPELRPDDYQIIKALTDANLVDSFTKSPKGSEHCSKRIDYIFFREQFRGRFTVRAYEAPCHPP
jgi:endonuclease/exonuclease/phosphatase family metal-dependent hydrolase